MEIKNRKCSNCKWWWYRLKIRYVTGKGECRNNEFNSMPHDGEFRETGENFCCLNWELIEKGYHAKDERAEL